MFILFLYSQFSCFSEFQLLDAKLDIQYTFQEGSTPMVDSVASLDNLREQSILISPSIGKLDDLE